MVSISVRAPLEVPPTFHSRGSHCMDLISSSVSVVEAAVLADLAEGHSVLFPEPEQDGNWRKEVRVNRCESSLCVLTRVLVLLDIWPHLLLSLTCDLYPTSSRIMRDTFQCEV